MGQTMYLAQDQVQVVQVTLSDRATHLDRVTHSVLLEGSGHQVADLVLLVEVSDHLVVASDHLVGLVRTMTHSVPLVLDSLVDSVRTALVLETHLGVLFRQIRI